MTLTFHVLTLGKLDVHASREAITKPVAGHPWRFREETVQMIIKQSGGYPYFLQFFGREVYDAWIQQYNLGNPPTFHFPTIIQKLDSDFFSGRWSSATDRQRELMLVIAQLPGCDAEFTPQEILEKSVELGKKPFTSNSNIVQMLAKLSDEGLVFKNRYGKYSFAVPLLGQFILRQAKE